MADVNELLNLLGQQTVQGNRDSSLFDLSQLMFCDIPSYLDLNQDEENIDTDVIENFDALLEELSDTSKMEKYVQSVIDKIQGEIGKGGKKSDSDEDMKESDKMIASLLKKDSSNEFPINPLDDLKDDLIDGYDEGFSIAQEEFEKNAKDKPLEYIKGFEKGFLDICIDGYKEGFKNARKNSALKNYDDKEPEKDKYQRKLFNERNQEEIDKLSYEDGIINGIYEGYKKSYSQGYIDGYLIKDDFKSDNKNSMVEILLDDNEIENLINNNELPKILDEALVFFTNGFRKGFDDGFGKNGDSIVSDSQNSNQDSTRFDENTGEENQKNDKLKDLFDDLVEENQKNDKLKDLFDDLVEENQKNDENKSDKDSETTNSDNEGDKSKDNNKDSEKSENDSNKDKDKTDLKKGDSNFIKEKSKELTSKSVIVEFAADTLKYSHEPYVWNVKPGQQIDKDTIIAYAKQRNKILPVRSIFNSGTVRVDEEDGDFARCWKTVTSRHIIIDDVEINEEIDGSSEFNYDALCEDGYLLKKVEDKLSECGDIFNVVTNHFMYVTYAHLLYYFGRARKSQEIPLVGTIWEEVPDSKKPEYVFSKFINDVYRPRVKKFRDDLQKASSPEILKASKGNIRKLKKIGQKCIDINNIFFEDIVDMYRNCHRYFHEVIIDGEPGERYKKCFKFFEKLDFKLQVMDEDNMNIKKDITYEDFVSDSSIDYESVRQVGTSEFKERNPLDGRYKDFHNYYNQYQGIVYDTYYSYLQNMGKNTDTFYEIDGKCDVHETEDHRRKQFESFSDYMKESSLSADVASKIKGGEVWAATSGQTYQDYFYNVTHELFNTEQYWSFKFKSLIEFVRDNHKNSEDGVTDIRWKIGEEVRRFDALFNCMVQYYRKFSVKNIDGSKSEPDYFRQELDNALSEVVSWPEKTDYNYEPTNEKFDRYVFLNNDEIEGVYKSSKKYTSTPLGDIDEISDYKEGQNDFIGYKPDGQNSYSSSLNVNDDVDYIKDGEGDDTIFGDNMMNPSKLINDFQKNAEDQANNPPNSPQGDVEDDFKKTPHEEDTTQQDCSNDCSKFNYWLKYFGMATLATMMYLGCGIPLPFMACIPLPCIYIPCSVIALNKVGMIIVIGIAIRGCYVGPIMLFVNMKSAENSMLIPITMSMAILMEQMQKQVDGISKMAMMSAAAESALTKQLLTSQLKMTKEYEAKTKALKGVQTEGKQSLIDSYKKDIGDDTKQIVTRLKTEIKEKKEETLNSLNSIKSGIDDIGSISKGNTVKTSDDNSKVSPSIQ